MNKNIRTTIFATVIVLILVFGIYVFTHIGFRITSTNPGLRRVATLSPIMDVNFSQDLGEQNFSKAVAGSNGQFKKTIKLNNKAIRIELGQMKDNTEYSFNVSVVSVTGKRLNKTLRFTTKNIPYDKLSKEQQKAILEWQGHDKGEIGDPILSYLPYGNLDFQLNAEFDSKASLFLVARILLSAADTKGDTAQQQAIIDTYKQEVVAYIKSVGLDPAKYNIQYQLVSPAN